MATTGEIKPDIVLNSPVGGDPAIYKWPLTYVSKGQKIDGAEEIVETIRWVGREFSELKPAIENLVPGQPDSKSYDCIKILCDKYNKILETVLKMNKGTSVAPKTSSRASQGLLKHIIQQVYNYAVADPTELNKYSPFSSETYGETNFDFMAQLIEKNQFKPREQDIFIDMGSGVGHLVLQMAASVDCKKCYGIEISDVPAAYAKVMEDRFKFWMDWHGKTYSEFELHHGDFFDKKYVDVIKSAAYIFVNNYAFKPEVDHKLKQRFLDLKDGVQILSSKPFCSPKSRVTERHLTDIGSIMQVSEIKPEIKKDSVSWTPKPLPYYLHVLDASPVEKYYERKKRRQGRSADRGRPNKRRKAGRGADSSDDLDDNVVYGPTTRKAWSEWCNSTSVTNRASTDSVKSSRHNSTDTENYESAIENDESKVSSKLKEPENSRTREKRAQETQSTTNEKQASAPQGTGTPTKANQSANQAAKSCLDKKRDYASKKTTSNASSNEKSYSCLTKTTPEATNGSSPSKVPPLVIKLTPPVESKGPDEPTESTRPTRAEVPKVKVNDENGKQLRQRKKSTTLGQASTTQASKSASTSKTVPKTDVKASQPTGSNNSTATPATTSATVTRGSKRVSQATAKSTPKAPIAASKKRTTSQDKTSCLDLLHAKTVESVSGNAGYFPKPAPGCQDHNLNLIVSTPSLPNVVIKDTTEYINNLRGQKTIDKIAEGIRGYIDSFARKLEKPDVRESLRREIERERQTKILLTLREQELHREIRFLNDRLFKVLKKHTDELETQNNIRSIVHAILSQLKKNQDMRWTIAEMETSIANQRTINPLPQPAHSNNSQNLSSPYHRQLTTSVTLDLSLKQGS